LGHVAVATGRIALCRVDCAAGAVNVVIELIASANPGTR